MPGIIFSEGSGLADSVYGNCQAPIRMFIEQYGEQADKESMLPHLFKMGTSDNYGDYLTEMTAMNGFEPVGENGAYPEDNMQEGYGKLLRYVTWKDSFSISQEMVEDGKLMDMTDKPLQFMSAYNRTREKFGAALFGGAINGDKSIKFGKQVFDCSSADGMALFHTQHPAKVKGNKQSNAYSNAFSLDALDRAEAAMHLYEGENGEILEVAPDTIVIPEYATLKREVFAAVGSDIDPIGSSHAFNHQVGRWNIVIWPYLNQFVKKGSKPWILMDSKFNETYGGAVWNDRIRLTVRSVIDNQTDANRWLGRSRFNATFKNWRAFCLGGMTGGTDLTTLDL